MLIFALHKNPSIWSILKMYNFITTFVICLPSCARIIVLCCIFPKDKWRLFYSLILSAFPFSLFICNPWLPCKRKDIWSCVLIFNIFDTLSLNSLYGKEYFTYASQVLVDRTQHPLFFTPYPLLKKIKK